MGHKRKKLRMSRTGVLDPQPEPPSQKSAKKAKSKKAKSKKSKSKKPKSKDKTGSKIPPTEFKDWKDGARAAKANAEAASESEDDPNKVNDSPNSDKFKYRMGQADIDAILKNAQAQGSSRPDALGPKQAQKNLK